MKGRLFAIGVGPGDPELITLKAVNILKDIDIIACPSKENRPGIAYDIAAKAVPEITKKQIMTLEFPMTKKDVTDVEKQQIIDEFLRLVNDYELRAEMNRKMLNVDLKDGFENIWSIIREEYRKFELKR